MMPKHYNRSPIGAQFPPIAQVPGYPPMGQQSMGQAMQQPGMTSPTSPLPQMWPQMTPQGASAPVKQKYILGTDPATGMVASYNPTKGLTIKNVPMNQPEMIPDFLKRLNPNQHTPGSPMSAGMPGSPMSGQYPMNGMHPYGMQQHHQHHKQHHEESGGCCTVA